MPDGSVVGDPANVEFTQVCKAQTDTEKYIPNTSQLSFWPDDKYHEPEIPLPRQPVLCCPRLEGRKVVYWLNVALFLQVIFLDRWAAKVHLKSFYSCHWYQILPPFPMFVKCFHLVTLPAQSCEINRFLPCDVIRPCLVTSLGPTPEFSGVWVHLIW